MYKVVVKNITSCITGFVILKLNEFLRFMYNEIPRIFPS